MWKVEEGTRTAGARWGGWTLGLCADTAASRSVWGKGHRRQVTQISPGCAAGGDVDLTLEVGGALACDEAAGQEEVKCKW